MEDLVALMSLPAGSLDTAYVDHWVKLLDESIGGSDVSERLAEARRRATKL
jgi:hypothetical protein